MVEVVSDAIASYLAVARLVVAGEIEPIRGAMRIWAWAAENDYPYFDEIQGFVAAASQWDEVPQHRRELTLDALEAAKQFLSRHETG